MKEKKQIKPNTGVGSLVKVKFRKMGENKREERSSRMRKYVVGCVQYMVGKNNFLVQF